MIRPMLEAGLDGAISGFGVETGLHLLRIITRGLFQANAERVFSLPPSPG